MVAGFVRITTSRRVEPFGDLDGRPSPFHVRGLDEIDGREERSSFALWWIARCREECQRHVANDSCPRSQRVLSRLGLTWARRGMAAAMAATPVRKWYFLGR